MSERLPANLEAAAIIRRVQADGGFAAVLRSGDPDRGALTLLLHERGRFKTILERAMGSDFQYRWAVTKPPESLDSRAALDRFVAARTRFDADFWLIELDIADTERFIAETISSS